MRHLRLVPDNSRFRFMRWRNAAYVVTLLVTILSLTSLGERGLNLGLDFTGGILIEARAAAPVDLAEVRAGLARLELGEVTLQSFGSDRDLLVRLQEQPGGAAGQKQAIAGITELLGPGCEIRRTEFVGPQVSRELLQNGFLAALLAVVLIGIYVWFRFEWQFGLSAVLTTFHDVIATFGLFSLLGLEFNLTIVAALLTIAGYSINDTVVIFDRIRENLRRYKGMPMAELIDRSVNQTLSRTLMTSVTTLLAVVSLLLLGGPVLRNFSLALLWGLVVGTYSSVFVASALLLLFPTLRREEMMPTPVPPTPMPPAPVPCSRGREPDSPYRGG